jgi:hypothetical protein
VANLYQPEVGQHVVEQRVVQLDSMVERFNFDQGLPRYQLIRVRQLLRRSGQRGSIGTKADLRTDHERERWADAGGSRRQPRRHGANRSSLWHEINHGFPS